MHHWWSTWFKTALEPRPQLQGKNRPKWYDASIVCALGVKRVRYAGHWFEEHCYQVHRWNGAGEEVPERFLRPMPTAPKDAEHSAGLVLNQGPDPVFWVPFNTNNVGAK